MNSTEYQRLMQLAPRINPQGVRIMRDMIRDGVARKNDSAVLAIRKRLMQLISAA